MSKENEQIENSNRLEMLKLMYDRYKHLTTMASGCLLITASFYERIFTPKNVSAVPYIVVCFLITIAMCITAMKLIIQQIPGNNQATRGDRVFAFLHYFIPETAFATGLGLLAFAVNFR